MTDIAIPQSDMGNQIEFARMVTTAPERGAQSMLPEAYRGNPANVLIAVGLGSSMGLSYAESLYRIAVIKGKPSAAAELVASNVRKAGHKLRLKVTENPPSATCTIIRADDPDEPMTVTRDMEWATRMGLASSENYRKQPATMLGNRAITACARFACPEALYGVAYSTDEMLESTPAAAPVKRTGLDALRNAVAPDADVVDAHVVEEVEPPAADTSEPDVEGITPAQLKALQASFKEAGITDRTLRLDYCVQLIGREVESANDLSKSEASAIIDALKADVAPEGTRDGGEA